MKINSILLLLMGAGGLQLLAVLAATPLAAQQPDAALTARIDSVFNRFNSTYSPGCAVGIDRAGAPLIRRAYGMANLETGTPFTPGTISESGSVAKQFVAAGLVLLVLDGQLSLDDDISKVIPEVQGLKRRITVRHLLSHTSGLPDRYLLHELEGRPAGIVDHPNSEVMKIVSRLRDLNFEPGEDYLYSNTGYVVAVAVLERVSGQSLQQYTHSRIFAPLGMTDSRWREDHRVVVPRRATAYAGTPATGLRHDHPFTRVFGSGGLLTTVDDFLKWSNALQRGDGTWGAVRDSLESVIKLNEGTAITYGLGVTSSDWRGARRVSHTGSTGGYRAALYRFPQQQLSVALLCNTAAANPADLATAVATVVLDRELQLPPAAQSMAATTMSPETLAAFAGQYWSPRTNRLLSIVVGDGGLVDSIGRTVFLPQDSSRFRERNSTVDLKFSGTGATMRVRREQAGDRAVEYVRVERPNMNAAVAKGYAGRYTSRELDAQLIFTARGDSLFVQLGPSEPVQLRPLYRDGFDAGEIGIVRFLRGPRDRVTGFVIWNDRVRNLRFDRVLSGN